MEEKDHRASSSEEIIKEREREREREREGRMIREKKSQTISERLETSGEISSSSFKFKNARNPPPKARSRPSRAQKKHRVSRDKCIRVLRARALKKYTHL